MVWGNEAIRMLAEGSASDIDTVKLGYKHPVGLSNCPTW